MKEEKKGNSMDLSQLLHQLIESYNNMLENINKLNGIMNKTKMLSLNSSIEAARAGTAGKGFSVIAGEIQKFSDQSKYANQESLEIIQDINKQINNVIGVRTADVAFDLIDKIDRNLFERNCDVQAWATFDRIVDYAANPTEEKKKEVVRLLFDLYEIYEVYYDIVMVNKDGFIVAAGVHTEMIGKDVSNSDWFQNAIKKSGCSVSEMYFSENYNDYTVSYSCRIVDEKGTVIGVLSTRFNWNYIYDILDKAKIGTKGEVYAINSKGIVIASRNKDEILKRNLIETYPEVQNAVAGDEYGYFIEMEKDKLEGIIGYAHTKGYNSYRGKKWSVIVRETF